MSLKNNKFLPFVSLLILILLTYSLLHNQTLGLPTDSDGYTILMRGIFANTVKIVVGLITSANIFLLMYLYITPKNKILAFLLTLIIVPILITAGWWISYIYG